MAEVENLKRHPFQNTPLQIRTLSPRERDWPYSTQEVHVRVQERTQIYLALHFSDKRDSELMEKEYLLGQIRRPLLLIAVLRGLEQRENERLHCPFLTGLL